MENADIGCTSGASGQGVTRAVPRNGTGPEESFRDFDHLVNVATANLRTALNDSPAVPRFVETFPRHGYPFIAPINGLSALVSKYCWPSPSEDSSELHGGQKWAAGADPFR